ncbi:MAG: response regulator transcription factor [Elusimicrobia bacterium]|nr:response regulator transcription factor [Elusimicrobiota bacterium]
MAKILVVDDEPVIVSMMKVILEKAGHAVASAGNGVEAVKALGIDPPDASVHLPDLVVLDIMMPIMDGYTVSVMMKDFPRTSTIPILIVTAKSDMASAFEAMPSVGGFFIKPFDPKALRDAVGRLVATK